MPATFSRTWTDRLIGTFSPQRELRRVRARLALDLLERHYEGAAISRRTEGWKRGRGDANADIGPSLARLRENARDLVRNNPYADSALDTIADDAVSWGIVAAEQHEAWDRWIESTQIDADGLCDFTGLQKLVMRTMVESGECLVQRVPRRLNDGLSIPLQIRVLEPDYLDTNKTQALSTGGWVIQGVEYDRQGRRVAFWMFRQHPGSLVPQRLGYTSERIPVADILHIYKVDRAGQVRGPSWFAPVLLRFKDFDEFDDATLMKQKIAACLSVITTDLDGSAMPLGETDPSKPEVDSLQPGMILNVPPGRSIEVVQPPTVRDYADYSMVTLRAIATGLGVTYEDLTGDYTDLPFSAARMSRLRHWSRVYDWRWRLLVPRLLDPVRRWAADAAAIAGLPAIPETDWTAPPMPMVEPDKEGLAIQRNIRSGIMTLSEAIRERGWNRERFLRELERDFKDLDARGLILDIDPRQVTQAGLTQARPAGSLPPKPGAFADPNATPSAGGGAGRVLLRDGRVVELREDGTWEYAA